MDPRLRAACDLTVATARELAGLHEYDGQAQDLSTDGVRAGLGRLGRGEPFPDTHDEAHLRAFEDSLRVELGDLGLHRRNPLLHIAGLDLACYDREYAPEEERTAARRAHLEAWPDAIDAAITSLDQVSAPTAEALLDAVRGLADAIPDEEGDVAGRAREAHGRLVAHVRHAATHGDPDPALGGGALARLMGASECATVDLGRLAEQADAERDRLKDMLEQACRRLDPERPALDLTRYLVLDHPDASGVVEEARTATREVIDFTRERNLVPYLDGQCVVGPAPRSRRFAMAMMAWSAPEEADAPSWYHITPPDPSWPTEDIDDWLAVFSRTMLPAVTAHEVAPGHFAHGRALRRASTAVRRILQSPAFAEGWAHYAEELFAEEGFREEDPRFVVGMCAEALIRVTRLACAIGVHTGAMTVDDAARRFAADTYIAGPAAVSEARRATFDPTYGRYTWGKLMIRDLREQARTRWSTGYSHLRFHTAMLDLGSPPLGLLGTALERG
ncbi:MAG: DUF885 family protein [Streptosporangiaceae bacterium]